MAYDPQTVLDRYRRMLDTPEAEPTDSACALACDGAIPHGTLGCKWGACESCCVGLVEVVRQFSEQAASLEVRTLDFDDTSTAAEKLTRPEQCAATDAAPPNPGDARRAQAGAR